MNYRQYEPHPALRDYIDAYWMASEDRKTPTRERILPDGCVDIIFNLGNDWLTDEGAFLMKNEQAYLVGTMTRFTETEMSIDTRLLGIRFKPAAFTAFYAHYPLHEITDLTIEFEKKLCPDLRKIKRYSLAYLDKFYLDKLCKPKHNLLPVIADINRQDGLNSVRELANKHFTTTRQLERQFGRHVGITPKEFINIVRFQSAYRKIKRNTANKSLQDIAFECGYYDHAHLGNEIKRFSGLVPSQL